LKILVEPDGMVEDLSPNINHVEAADDEINLSPRGLSTKDDVESFLGR
jgi:hypothetical protein